MNSIRFDQEQGSATSGSVLPRDDCETWLGNVAGMQAAAVRFVEQRLSSDAQTLDRLSKCRSPMEFALIQAQAGAEATSDYLAYMRRCYGIFDATLADAALPIA